MQSVATLELLRRAARQVACTRCQKRPHEPFSPQVNRPCETECTIFANLPKLAKIAHDDAGDRRAPTERQMCEQICLNCHVSTSAGKDCEQRASRQCPLSVYLLDLIEPMQRILAVRWRQHHLQAARELKGM